MATMTVLNSVGGTETVEKPMSVENNALLTSIDTKLTTIDGHVDGLETAVAATNTALATTNTNLTTIDGRVDGLETLIGSTNTKLDSLITIGNSTTDSPVEVHQPADVITVTPTISTSAYTSGYVLFATTAISGVTRANDLRALLTSLTIIDKAKQNAAMTLLFYQTNVTSAAANAANALSDADQINCLGYVDIAAADWKTFANNSVLCYSGAKAPNLLLESATGSTSVYAVAITTSTPTYGSTSDLVFKLGIVQS